MPKKPTSKTQKPRVTEDQDLRARLDEAEETLRAIRSGEVDALVVSGEGGEQIFTLKGANRPYRVLIEEMSEGALTLTADGVILYANRRFAEMLRTPLEKVIGSTIYSWIAPDCQGILESLLQKGANEKRREELELTAGDGTQVPVYLSVSPLLMHETPDSFCAVATDMTEHRRIDGIVAAERSARELLAASDQSRRALLSVIEDQKRSEEALRDSEKRFRAVIENSSDAIALMGTDGNINYRSPAAYRLVGQDPAAPRDDSMLAAVHPDDVKYVRKAFAQILQAPDKPLPFQYRAQHLDGSWRWVEGVATNLLTEPAVHAVVANYRDITERKRAEVERQALFEIMQGLAATESLQELLRLMRRSLAKVIYAENFFVVFHNESTGLFEEVFAVDKYDAPMTPSKLERSITSYIFRTGEPLLLTQAKFEELLARSEVELVGTKPAAWLGAPLKTASETIGVIAVQNYEDPNCYSERDREFLASVGMQVSVAIQRKQAEHEIASLAKFPSENPNPVLRLSPDGIVIYANAASSALLDTWRCAVGGSAPQFWCGLAVQLLASGENQIVDLECDGKVYAMSVAPVPDAGYVNLYGRDITERKKSTERIQRQLEHLTAVSEIDRAIASSLDLRFSLSEVLAHVTKELSVDAADVLLLDPVTQMLVYAAGSGFRTKALQHTRLALGQGYAGRAGQERRMVHVATLPMHELESLRDLDFKTEEFETYFALPLIAKGKLVGVLEAFRRTAFEPDPEWVDFLKTLAGQAAIAIDGIALFDNLQRSNVDLSLAYDATIAGWSSAMDLRDKETEGHTQRVTEMCVNLARLFGLGEAELVQVRRGGLLHDMGKMGVPDSVLLKPGPLTDEEWVIMKRHPMLAFEMLSPIRYLRAALDIPYCHHEKWDGSGYPRGLKAEQIPLAARIFAVIDVWDALTSDRPYRKAWTREKALEYIRSQAGTHFDPQVVKVFLESDVLRTS